MQTQGGCAGTDARNNHGRLRDSLPEVRHESNRAAKNLQYVFADLKQREVPKGEKNYLANSEGTAPESRRN